MIRFSLSIYFYGLHCINVTPHENRHTSMLEIPSLKNIFYSLSFFFFTFIFFLYISLLPLLLRLITPLPQFFFTILFLQTTQQALMHQKTELILTTAREKGKKKTHVDIELNRKKWRNRKTRILNKA